VIEIPENLKNEVSRLQGLWTTEERTERIWRREASVWTDADESHWLEWLEESIFNLDIQKEFVELRELFVQKRIRDVVLIGMGGASLTAEVMRDSFSGVEGFPNLHIVNTLDPKLVRHIDQALDYEKSMFVVSSKSGSTLETLLVFRYFAQRFSEAIGDFNGDHFIAITDNKTGLEDIATSRKFQKVIPGRRGIGGRFSSISVFGQVPACVLGLDLSSLARNAKNIRERCRADVPPMQNDGLSLGLVLAAAVETGRDKITFVISPRFSRFGDWVEQLLAESTGKSEKGVIPITSERLGDEAVYGNDRIFIYMRDSQSPDGTQDAGVERLKEAKWPLVQVDIKDPYELAGEFFRWQFATVVLASVLKINPFTQPDVEASKVEAQRMLQPCAPFRSVEGKKALFNGAPRILISEDLDGETHKRQEWIGQIKKFLSCFNKGDYLVFLAFVECEGKVRTLLSEIQHGCRDGLQISTSLVFGPQYLHSTGQMHKGGKNTGVFIQITCDDDSDIPVAGYEYTFGTVRRAQAASDLKILQAKGRRILHVHIAGDLLRGVKLLSRVFNSVVKPEMMS
tara:strand:- start:867 stop:2573 length:1707 start_codon:yes stop_codon:yes gene_type:complete